jgi:PPOX class probable F420-dependent enzyme
MSPTAEQLWQLVADRGQGVLATINKDGSPQLSNVLYVPDTADRLVRISTTADRVKARNLRRDPRAVLHVAGDDFWQYAVAHGITALSAVAVAPGDAATDQLFAVHSVFYGDLDRDAFDEEMIANQRLVVTLRVTRLRGIVTNAGRRPVDARRTGRISGRPRLA